MVFDGSHVNLLIAFLGGIITFFASCLLPLTPTYLAYISGASIAKQAVETRREVFLNSLAFTLGFIFVFTALGMAATSIGSLLIVYRSLIQKIGGVFFILLGMLMMGAIKNPIFYKEIRLNTAKHVTKWRILNSLVVGATFGFAWTPCIGPVLAVILFWASQSQSFWYGTLLLLTYGVGLGMPFLAIGLFFDLLAPKLRNIKNLSRVVQKVSGAIIILMGFLLIAGRVDLISLKLLELLNLRTLAV
ncbi:sulfite exporter TauE/SafE family protein [candidate division WWE3 bacterium]|nr:sulfite exporter TauE/SafE family protein [candidate division WWE3 bacterium]